MGRRLVMTPDVTAKRIRPALDWDSDPRRCLTLCPGGQRCTLTTIHPHTLHICGEPGCVCHGLSRYESDRQSSNQPPTA